jgi:hypothetical protein
VVTTWTYGELTWAHGELTWTGEMLTWAHDEMTWTGEMLTWAHGELTWTGEMLTWADEILTWWAKEYITWFDCMQWADRMSYANLCAGQTHLRHSFISSAQINCEISYTEAIGHQTLPLLGWLIGPQVNYGMLLQYTGDCKPVASLG